jgi:hypothetical protein
MADEDVVEEAAEFDEELEEEEIDPDELDPDELEEDDELGELEPDDELETVEASEETEEEEADATTKVRRPATDDDDDDEDLVDPDDVEADLDTILKDRLVAAEEEADEDDEEVEVDDRGDPVDRILPKRPGEFVCQSCFLVKHPSQLADARRQLCSDCV